MSTDAGSFSPSHIRALLAPRGVLRAGVNRSNVLLVDKTSPRDDPRGVAPDLARELARRLSIDVVFASYDSPGALADAAPTDAWDVGFLGAEPSRADTIDFTDAYGEIEATYLVTADSPLHVIQDVDRPGMRIAVSGRSAYDLYLTRTLQHATLVRAEGVDASYDLFVDAGLDALAGLRPRLIADARRMPDARVLNGRFTAIQQAIGTPKGRGALAYLQDYVRDITSTGIVARAIADHHADGLSVASR